MTLSVHHRLSATVINDENGRTACRIRRLGFWSAQNEIYASENKLVYTTDILAGFPTAADGQAKKRRYVAYCAGDHSKIAAAASPEYGKGQPPLPVLIPPRVDALKICSEYGELEIRRAGQKELAIGGMQGKAGHIYLSPLSGVSSMRWDAMPSMEFGAVLLAFAGYMLREDELSLV